MIHLEPPLPDTSHLATYAWQWDNANRITQFTNGQHTGENVDYDYDESGQLPDADYNGGPTDESYTYDNNGNRIDVDNDAGSVTYTTGANNRLDSDGAYDGEGNLVKRTEISSGDYRVFEWDHRNRLASISDFDDTNDLHKFCVPDSTQRTVLNRKRIQRPQPINDFTGGNRGNREDKGI